MKKKCDIIRDLLPLYHDNVCSDESRREVEEHLAECESCREELKMMDTTFTAPHVEDDEKKAVKASSRALKKAELRAALALCLTILCLVSMTAFCFLYYHYSTSVDGGNTAELEKKAEESIQSLISVDNEITGTITPELDLSIIKTIQRGDYIVTLLRNKDNAAYVWYFERDSVFKNRFYPCGISLGNQSGKIGFHGSASGREMLFIFCGTDLPAEARNYSFVFDGITYICPIKDGIALDVFVMNAMRDGEVIYRDIDGFVKLLDENGNTIEMY